MNNKRPILISLLISTIIVIGFITGNNIFTLLGFLIYSISLIFIKTEEMLLTLIFLLPFATIFKTEPNVTSLYTIAELFSVVIYIIKKGKFLNKKFLFVFVIFYSYLLIVDLANSTISVDDYLRIFVDFFLLFYFVTDFKIYNNKEELIKNVILFFSLGLIASSVVGLYSSKIPNFNLYIRTVGYNPLIQNRFSGLNGDPNYYSINVIISLFGLLILYSKKYIDKLFWLLFITLVYLGSMTFSKSFYITLAVILLLLLYFLIRGKNKKGLMVTSIFGIILLYLLFNNKLGNLNLFLIRFDNVNDANSLTTGRFNLWKNYIDYISSNLKVLLFGVGIGNNILSVGGVHNWYIEMIYYFGFFGTILYLANFVTIFRLYKTDSTHNKFVKYLPFVLLLIMYFFLQMIFSNEIIFQFFVVYLIHCLINDETTKPYYNSVKEVKKVI